MPAEPRRCMKGGLLGGSDIEKVRDATDLVQLIGEHLSLKPRGREFVGLCPFHDDHRPSFAVITHKGSAFYKCHSCGAAGDAFTFVQQYHKMDFAEALRFLAERANITLSHRRDELREAGAPSRAELRKATAYAADFYRKTLADPDRGDAARRAIAQRGISDAMAEQFGLGAAPDQWDGLCAKLRAKPSAVRVAEAAGLLRQRNGGHGHYDYFRNRLIFPICDETGTPVAFGGRALDSDDTPKYLNSPESAIFIKSRTLYGLNLAKRAIIDSGRAVVTEGYTDVIACHQAGVRNVVGTLGTALTREHATVLARLCDTVALVFDGDEAGVRAADRAVEVFFATPVDVRICILPDELDPDELLRQAGGAERFREALDKSVDALDFKVARFRDRLDGVRSLSGRQKALEGFLGELVDLGFDQMQGVRKRLVLTQLADLLGVSLTDLQASMPKRRPRGGASAPSAASVQESGVMPESMTWTESSPLLARGAPLTRARRLAEREFLSLLIYDPSAACRTNVGGADGTESPVASAFGLNDFRDDLARTIAGPVLGWLAEGRAFVMQDLLSALDDEGARQLAGTLFFEAQARCGDDDLAATSQLEAAARVLMEQMTRDELRGMDEAGTRSPDRAAPGLEDLIESRRRQGHRPDAIFVGARPSGRK